VTALHDAGVAVFAAAGNNGRTNGLPAPACFPAAIAVGAVYARNVGSFTAPNICVDKVTYANELACFSNTSSRLALLAVGAPVDAVALGGMQASIAGTSAAAAQAAGVAALVLQASPGLTPDALLALLQETGTPVRDPRSHVVQPVVPRIDAAAALGRVLGHAIPLLPPPPGLGPSLDVEAKPVSFGRIRLGGAVRRRLVVRNAGLGTLTVRTSTTSRSVQVAPRSLSLTTEEQAVTLTFRPPGAGGYRGTIRLVSDDPAHPLVRIPFTGRAS
jgi:subtilisin family serine protease